MATISIIIPCLNEQSRIVASAEEATRGAIMSGHVAEIIFVNDGSTDDTEKEMRRFAGLNENVKVLTNKTNRGLGYSYGIGAMAATGDFITWVPGDLSHLSHSLADAYSRLDGADLTIPNPINPAVRPLFRRVLSKSYTHVVNFASGNRLHYYNGLSIYRRDVLREVLRFASKGFGFQAELIVAAIARGYTWQSVPTYIEERQIGHSRAFNARNIARVFQSVFSILLRRFKGYGRI